MASINSIMNSGTSSTSSLYGTRNVLSGLASGMDTETMIENMIAGYQTKIAQLQQQQTKITWKQDAFRSITDKLISLSDKYTSYTSQTNLSSPSFFLNAVNTTTNGTNASKVSATGRTNSDIKINAVKQLASAARYSVDATVMNTKESVKGAAVDFNKKVEQSNIKGDLTLTVGKNTVTLTFDDDDIIKNASQLAQAINDKLAEQDIGKNKANTMVKAVNSSGTIRFETIGDAKDAGDTAWISSVNGDIKDTLKITAGALGKGDTSLKVAKDSDLYTESNRKSYLSYQDVQIKLGEESVTVNLGDLHNAELNGEKVGDDNKKLLQYIQEKMQKAADEKFGEKKLKISIEDSGFKFAVDPDTDGKVKDAISVTSKVGDGLGLGRNGLSTAMSTNSTLREVLGDDYNSVRNDIEVAEENVRCIKKSKDGTYEAVEENNVWYKIDKYGNHVKDQYGKDEIIEASEVNDKLNVAYEEYGLDDKGHWVRRENKKWYQVYSSDPKADRVKSDDADLVINGVKVGTFNRDSTIEEILSKINNSEADVRASYSTLTNKFVLKANKTGADSKIEISGALGEKLFGATDPTKAEMNTNKFGLVSDNDGNAIVAGYDKDGKAYYLKPARGGDYFMANESGGTLKYPNNKPVALEGDVLKVLEAGRKGYEAGKDAIINATVNGDNITLTRSTNVIEMDGMSVTIKDTFNDGKDANGVSYFDEKGNWNKNAKLDTDSVVTFTTKADADKLVEAVQEFVKEYNELATQVRTEYSTTPLKDSNKKTYEPLTEKDMEDMTENQIKAYEEKAKTGLLFGDTDLSSLHNSLRNVITPSGSVRGGMTDIGLTTTYKDGVTTLSFNEEKFRAALEKDVNAVQKVFTASKENGDSYDGLMARAKKTINSYASTSIGNYGILVNKAGTKTSSLSLTSNTLQKKYNSLEEQIERWQDKMSDKVDYYTKQFSRLEQLINEMNSQSSSLAGMMGGY